MCQVKAATFQVRCLVGHVSSSCPRSLEVTPAVLQALQRGTRTQPAGRSALCPPATGMRTFVPMQKGRPGLHTLGKRPDGRAGLCRRALGREAVAPAQLPGGPESVQVSQVVAQPFPPPHGGNPGLLRPGERFRPVTHRAWCSPPSGNLMPSQPAAVIPVMTCRQQRNLN